MRLVQACALTRVQGSMQYGGTRYSRRSTAAKARPKDSSCGKLINLYWRDNVM